MRHLVQVAEVAAKGEPALAGLFVMAPRHAPHRTFLTSAKGLLAAATAHEATLVPLGLGEGFVAEFRVGITAFEELSEEVHAGRRDHVGARAELAAIAEAISDLARLLDGLNRARYAEQPDLLAAWESARNVEGPFRAKRDAVETTAQPSGRAA
jgi:hypothetical protein